MKRIVFLMTLFLTVLSCGSSQKVLSSQTSGETIDMGYSSSSRNSNAFTVTEVTMTEAEEQVYNNIFDYLRNKVPGVEVGNTQMAGDRPHIQIRGNRSILGNEGEPLYIVDGVEFPQIDILKPDEIYSVRVLKDSAASSYGSRGANGVILFTTKVAQEAAEREKAQRKAERQQRNKK
ncbi:MAG: TonB-dependent receptor plug domain-containing protein [Bacteroidales bacterium]|jgi:TonB-dependent SusC/RagA subfamily outer membrane receptor|nr:TonB-dependent receptor plug domain-containing protein [Bacteroidales bacterium]